MPLSINKYGTYGVRAKGYEAAEEQLQDARLLQEVGCYGIVLEKIPAELARKVSEELTIPMIGIGAGPYVDGQVLVMQDMLGLNKGFSPRFLRQYANLFDSVTEATRQYIKDVKLSDFPSIEESY